MELNSAILKRNAGLIYGVIILLGTILSGIVYNSTQNIKQNALLLVDHEIKVFERLQNLNSLFIEQELYLNEYYANQNREVYQTNFNATADKVSSDLVELAKVGVGLEYINQLSLIQLETIKLASEFDDNMQLGDASDSKMWDLARTHLEILAMYRIQIKPVIAKITESTNERIVKQYNNTKQSLDTTNQIVLAYSVMIILIAYFVGRAIRTSIMVSVRNRRLALFPERNPNAILSIDVTNEVKYTNPAMLRLLTNLKIDIDEFKEVIAIPLKETKSKVCTNHDQQDKFEVEIGDSTLECNLHWLSDLENWDLHILDITQKKRAEAQMHYQAFHDMETGLFNKNQFLADLEKVCDIDKNSVVGLVEVRHYSHLITRLGLQQTSEIIVQLALLLNKELKTLLQDVPHTLYRTSDKQFSVVVQSDICNREIANLVNKLEKIIETFSFENTVNLELDFGFTCFPEHASEAQTIVKSATIALDSAIKIDHSPLVIFSEQLGDSISKEIELTNDLRVAIEKQQLELYFQPQLDIQKNQIIGVETLIRWQLRDKFIPPIDFIPLAEKTGLIVPLGDWILLNACNKAAALIEQGYKDIVVAINISPQQFNHPSFYDTVVGVLEKTQVPAENIELEITEGVIMYNETDTIAMLQKLKDSGVKLSIDDFGTGYSSLSYLKQFPIDKLKIDQSFIRQIELNKDDKAIVSTVIELGNNLGLTLIAEGVEELSHMEILSDLGCQEIQGYYFSRPLPSAKLDLFLTEFGAKNQQSKT
ncbi:bifunctional diguanylate cyclase/phosphodiesterase [Psychrosphaera sp. B3R10]|uniref:putative bifunctional diguanylate cyclase/phosphodiesterase n=1 Tax=unclassified Psychrosphaera TaxID=2641570 RepID=UPI001C099016|nr:MULTISPECIES: bifunctional diguanylate cyclase/phosphodiesterase [unclassified Psychrosphaera]MBU2882120.1 bifunctional diguanylate cyclase/phosphodiesterase [Psychrosphaera sp. I2R16]MBU2988801.1 bifunctional diguanylate cyclase/phosphodiesterase [Psychrosphaera sp. B3R10]